MACSLGEISAVAIRWLSALFLLLSCSACGRPENAPRAVSHIDLARYAGIWYEIARYPTRFEKNCAGAMAIYRVLDDGGLEVVNRCRDIADGGRIREIKGYAKVPDPLNPAELKVTFFWPLYGHYWVIALSEDYTWAVVGHPQRKYLWILARQPVLDQGVLQKILSLIVEQGYEPERLVFADQGK